MTLAMKRAGLAAVVAAVIGAGACNKNAPVDDALKADLAAAGGNASDLQLAGAAAKPQVVVSAIEGGPTSAPAKAAPTKVAKPSAKPVTHVAPRKQTPAPTPTVRAEEPAPAPVEKAPAMEAPAPAPAPIAAPAPAPAPREDHRVYKTEGEIFRQMPWIRP